MPLPISAHCLPSSPQRPFGVESERSRAVTIQIDIHYRVGHDETVHSVSCRFGVSPQRLMQANPELTRPGRLEPHSMLRIPSRTGSAGPGHSDGGVGHADGSSGHANESSGHADGSSGSGSGSGSGSTSLPLGDGKYSFDGPRKGYVYLDRATSPVDSNNPNGSSVNGPWIHGDGTYDPSCKVVVEGAVEWPSTTTMSLSADGQTRSIATNDLPKTSGIFPIRSDSQAYAYDRNPNTIQAQKLGVDLPVNPKTNDVSTPLSGGAIGFVYSDASRTTLTALFAAVDEKGNDAVAHEIQDSNKGHPQESGEYHFHSAPEALKDAEGVIGYALDGFPIMGSMEKGHKVTNADLDENHGKFTEIDVEGKKVKTYAYYATDEYPYTIGAFKGTPAKVYGEIAPSTAGGRPPPGQPGATPPNQIQPISV